MEIIVEVKREKNKKVQYFNFDVPIGCRKITFKKQYKYSADLKLRTKIDMSFYDCEGKFYGRFDRNKNEFVIEEGSNDAILPGKWTVAVEVFAIYNDVDIILDIDFEITSELRQFSGELHAHSNYSDGKLSTKDLFEHMESNGYDFFFLTDHNTIRGWNDLDSANGIKVYKGLELTTFDGHILLLGVNDYLRWYGEDGNIRPFKSIYDEVKLKHGLMGIAHPYTCGGVFCAGCRWNYPIEPEHFDFIEIWNSKGRNWRENWEAVELWFDLLRKDVKILATSGADFHIYDDLEPSLRTVVLSPENTERHIINSMKLGRYYLSKNGNISMKLNNKILGENLKTDKPVNLEYKIDRDNKEDITVCLVTKKGIEPLSKFEDTISLENLEEKDFVVLMGLTKERKLEFITNPIFVEKL